LKSGATMYGKCENGWLASDFEESRLQLQLCRGRSTIIGSSGYTIAEVLPNVSSSPFLLPIDMLYTASQNVNPIHSRAPRAVTGETPAEATLDARVGSGVIDKDGRVVGLAVARSTRRVGA
jgi:hypothetical protein